MKRSLFHVMKKPWIIIGIVIAGLGGLFVLKNSIAKVILVGGIKAIAGVDASIEHMDVGLLRTSVGVHGLRIANPRGFPDPTMVDMPELYVDYALLPFFAGQVHLQEVRIHLREVVVEKNATGQLNLASVTAVRQAQTARPAQAPPPGKPTPLLIDVLQLQIGKVVYKDYTAGPQPRVQEFIVHINERYEHITNPQALASLIVVKALAKTTIARLANFDVTALRGQAEDALTGAATLATHALDSAAGLGENVGEEAARTAGKTLKAFKKLLPTDR